MKKRLRVKFAVLYGLFALLSFIAVSTFTMSLTRKYETKKVADSLSEFHHLAHGHQRKYPHQHLSSF